ncbi:MAG TPA: CocE/NonD family hydrolase [Fontimonas sp.]
MNPSLRMLLLGAALTLAACGGDSGDGSSGGGSVVDKSGWTGLGTRMAASQPAVAPIQTGGQTWSDYDPAPIYPGTVAQENLSLTVDDGTVITMNLVRPALAGGEAESAPLPTIVTFTPYNKNVGNTIPLGGGINNYFVQRGYNHVLVDVRGTGRSGGAWDPFSAREQLDYPQVLDWIVAQPWSNGDIGMWGISATATTAMFAGGQRHPAIKSVFAIVPHGDIYRDVVFVGGQASVAFLPAWMSVVTLLATLDPQFYVDPAQYLSAVVDHLLGLNGFIVPRTLGVLLGQADSAFDNDYWADKAPLEQPAAGRAPTFIVGGLFDIFQRSEPLNYEALKGETPTKLLIGPWHHLQAATGEGLPLDGVPSLDHIALRWFDRYLKGIDNGAEDLPNVTQWVWGHEGFAISSDWPPPQARASRLYLQAGGVLGERAPEGDVAPSVVLQQPVNGICSESAMQISLGLLAYAPLPCWYEDNLVQQLEATFDSAPMAEDFYINGPIQADIWMSTSALNAGLVVRVSDLDDSGTARSLSSGIQTASLRAVDESRSRYLDGEMIQPWHPYTQDAVEAVGSGNIVKVAVEVFPTSALIRQGHRLRISVGAANFPFAAMPVPSLLVSAAGLLSVYHDAAHASSVVLPVVPAAALR